MKIRHSALVGLISSAICLGLLFLVYPWSTYYSNFMYGAGVTAFSYLLLALLVGLVGTIVVGVLSFCAKLPALGQCALTGVLSFVSLFAGSLLLGPAGIDILDTRVGGIFFSEWKFVTFDGCIALPISIVDAALVWWAVRQKSKVG